MRPAELAFLDDDLDEDLEPTDSELGLPLDYARDSMAYDDELGFRALYEDPGAMARARR